jgi:hypothetical protein
VVISVVAVVMTATNVAAIDRELTTVVTLTTTAALTRGEIKEEQRSKGRSLCNDEVDYWIETTHSLQSLNPVKGYEAIFTLERDSSHKELAFASIYRHRTDLMS